MQSHCGPEASEASLEAAFGRTFFRHWLHRCRLVFAKNHVCLWKCHPTFYNNTPCARDELFRGAERAQAKCGHPPEVNTLQVQHLAEARAATPLEASILSTSRSFAMQLSSFQGFLPGQARESSVDPAFVGFEHIDESQSECDLQHYSGSGIADKVARFVATVFELTNAQTSHAMTSLLKLCNWLTMQDKRSLVLPDRLGLPAFPPST